ncbi:hypothetical protein LCGC14_0245700 [marine sediment metagenome]|uniref:Uncharacterized protein n=1 Tax=marine sediment metagenome TaxID=412755 RepID=A0A0F9UAJ4_9ZZZZ
MIHFSPSHPVATTTRMWWCEPQKVMLVPIKSEGEILELLDNQIVTKITNTKARLL